MKLTMLGTGNAMVSECYNTCFIIEDGGRPLLVDGGGGNCLFKQLKRAGFDFGNIHDIIITHKHIDHILGVVWMVRLIAQSIKGGGYSGNLNIYGHDEALGLLKSICTMLLQKKQCEYFDDRIIFSEVKDGEAKLINGRKITFFDIRSAKAKQFGFCLEYENGARLTCCGDEPYNDCERVYAEGCSWLLHEAFCLHAQAELFKPYEKHHSTVKDACELAEKLGVKNLVLYHTEDKNIEKRKELYLEEGRRYFKGNIYVPEDLEAIVISS